MKEYLIEIRFIVESITAESVGVFVTNIEQVKFQ